MIEPVQYRLIVFLFLYEMTAHKLVLSRFFDLYSTISNFSLKLGNVFQNQGLSFPAPPSVRACLC